MDKRIGKLATPGVMLALLVLLANAVISVRNAPAQPARRMGAAHATGS